MTNHEVMQLADEIGISPSDKRGLYECSIQELVAFANACEKIGMEKAAKEAEKTVTMEGYEKEIAQDIRALINSKSI